MKFWEYMLAVAALDAIFHAALGFLYLLMSGFDAQWIVVPPIQRATWSQIVSAEVLFYILMCLVFPPRP